MPILMIAVLALVVFGMIGILLAAAGISERKGPEHTDSSNKTT